MAPFGLSQERNDLLAVAQGVRPGPTDYNFEKSTLGGQGSIQKLKSRALGAPAFGASKPRTLNSEDMMKSSNQDVGPSSYGNMQQSPIEQNMARYQAYQGKQASLSSPKIMVSSPIRDTNSFLPQQGSNEKVGPGSYFREEMMAVNSRLPIKDWSRDQSDRFPKAVKTQSVDSVGPGYYNLVKKPFAHVSQHQVGNRTGAFASETKRGVLEEADRRKGAISAMQMPLKRGGSTVTTQQQPLINKSRMRDNSMNQSLADEVQNEDNSPVLSPGPGQYASHYHNSSFSQKQMSTVQTFGLKQARFYDNSYTEQGHLERQRGPGQYQQSRMPIKKKNNLQNPVGFASSDDRQTGFNSGNLPDDIGPGAYSLPGIAQGVHSYNKSKAAKQFGIGQKKFHSLKVAQQPGPADYSADKSLEILNNKRDEINVQSSMFLNREKRMPDPKERSPIVGKYDPGRYEEMAVKSQTALKKSEMRTKVLRPVRTQSEQQLQGQASTSSIATFSKISEGHRFGGQSKNLSKNFQNFVDSCRGPGTYESSIKVKPKLFSNASTTDTNVHIMSKDRNFSPNKPKGLAKPGRILVQSESEQLINVPRKGTQMGPEFNSIQVSQSRLMDKAPGPGEYELDMWRGVGANKSFNLKYL